jgi:imidazolonepropionase-like amidohydrolase
MSFYTKFLGVLLLSSVLCQFLAAQQTFPQNGVFDQRDDHYAFTNANIQVSPDKKIEKGTLLIKKGKIVAVGSSVIIPKDAVVIDLQGKYIFPSFIDIYSDYGMPKQDKKGQNWSGAPQMLSNKPGAFSWNEALKSEINAAELFTVDEKKAEEMRKAGFGATLTHHQDGIARGTGSFVLLGSENEHDMVVRGVASAHYSFSKGSSTQDYPSSLMGCIALIRQAYYDSKWYAANPNEREYNLSLEKWNEAQKLPQIFEANQRLNVFRADKIGDEFGVQYIIKGGGDEYRRIEAIKATAAKLIIPINFPDAYDVSDPYAAEYLKIGDMLHWELAPGNPAELAKAAIPFAITASGLKSSSEFHTNLRRAYQAGLSEKDLLASLTTVPASMLGLSKECGALEVGMTANFFISTGHFLSEKSSMLHNWVKGKPYAIGDLFAEDIRGTYEMSLAGKTFELSIKGNIDSPEASIKELTQDSSKKADKLKISFSSPNISFNFDPVQDTSKKNKEVYRLSGTVSNDNWTGQGIAPDGSWINWSAKRTKTAEENEMKLPKADSLAKGEVIYPFLAYGYKASETPKQETVLLKNATVWTGEKDGILQNTDLLIENGKIAKVGKKLKAPAGAKEIDATGKHITAGIIDEHSHIAIQNGVNEGTQSSSAEVRISDVTNSDDVNIYRHLAGGVTTTHSLHGSANPIGGQSAIVKMRWGKTPEEMQFKEAPGFIKFALGENVKQANWGERQTIRFPQTRMGVEQVYEDHFTRAREYGEARKANADKVRRDLELDCIYEILNSKRFISCHSYVQSEITMLMRVAEKHGFKINTFTHILEGYKVADKMKKHGVGASSFSDWWAYKAEVMDAIPYNARLMHEMGVVTAINSDDAEMGRRLNQEAAKGVKYGGMGEAEAMNMVTLNPAKLLRVDQYVGSIKAGKQADLVLWSDNPLSVYAKAVQTYVDGICYFDLARDQQMRKELQADRSRLMQKMLNAKAGGAKTQAPAPSRQHHYHCGDIHLNELEGLNWKLD